ncbi:MBL fold metallo-hydrolase [Chitinasiproducens palmae]|uniref:Glyoxylase, beta-lactamase superfamily II n=1 Tax=Chitinasiproducens palmae TaxID=1770053 RepID=A0A1H2PPF0_9BURK|nr:MBL fold metallo-hydrolase [Chitinasiproducens palmae]SDV48618.1 Glyoxylase, beta-lactamase superfamily II [Chitinasiproducens palmae]
MKVILIPVTPFQQNSSLLICERTQRAAAVDPGGDLDRIEHEISRHGVRLEKVLLTHGHLDHCGGADELARRHDVPIEGPHTDDLFLLESLPAQAARLGFGDGRAFEPARWLAEGDAVSVGEITLRVRHCPGHTPGHVIFFQPENRLALVGDVLFAGSIGRTDLPRGNQTDLIRSIVEKLWPLGEDVTFVPGHGPVSTFGDERRGNPYVGDDVTGYGGVARV